MSGSEPNAEQLVEISTPSLCNAPGHSCSKYSSSAVILNESLEHIIVVTLLLERMCSETCADESD